MSGAEKPEEQEEEETITIVLGKKGENITTKQIMIMDKEQTFTHTPNTQEVIATEINKLYTQTGKYPTSFAVTIQPTKELVVKAADAMEKVADAMVKSSTATQNMEGARPELLGGYRVTRRRNPRRKQKKSYRRRRV